MGFFDKIDNVSGRNDIKKVLYWRSSKMFVTNASQCRTFNQNVLECLWAMSSRALWLISARQQKRMSHPGVVDAKSVDDHSITTW